MDAKITITTEQEGDGFYIAQLKTSELAVFTYYVESNGQALIIDPTYDVKAFKDIIAKRNSNLKAILLSHYHADFLSGHTQFEAPIIMGPHAKREINKFEVKEHEDSSLIQLGDIKLQVIHTPGHTSESSSFLLNDKAGVPNCVFTGDTLFLGEVGRPDLAVRPEATVQDEAAILFASLKKLKALDGTVRVYPGHGSGSACGKAIGAGDFCSIENQKIKNNMFKITDEAQFVKIICAGVSKPPKYFPYDAKLNQIGVSPYSELIEKANKPLSAEEFQVLSEKVAVIDTRAEPESIIRGKNVFWLTSKGTTANWLANILPSPETEYILFTETGKWQDIAERLFRIGYFNIKGYNSFTMADWKGQSWKPQIVKFDQVKELKDVQYLDCRNKPEWVATGTLQKAILIPLPELPARVAELKDQKSVLIHCRTGMRARVAASILAQQGIDSIVFAEPVDQFSAKGFKMVPYQE